MLIVFQAKEMNRIQVQPSYVKPFRDLVGIGGETSNNNWSGVGQGGGEKLSA